jgi:hypothetical protein
MFKNDYCYIGGPSDQIFKEEPNVERVHIVRYDGFMVYVEPKNGVLYYKVLPKEFINKPKEFFENLMFDGFLCHSDKRFFNLSEIYVDLYKKFASPIEREKWITTFQGQRRAPFMYKNIYLWF